MKRREVKKLSYLEERNWNTVVLHRLYCQEFPDYLKDFLNVPEVSRLNSVELSGGIHLSGFPIFPYRYSVLDHSVGVALILNHFVNNKKQVISALIHDINTPAFSFSSQLIEEDNFEKEDVALSSYDMVVGSNNLFEYFVKNDVDISDMCDDTKYPLAYNFIPHLCAYHLEHFMHTAYLSGMCNVEELKEIYDDLFITANEERMPEFCFKSEELAFKFAHLTMECGKKFRSYEAKMAMQFVADTLAAMVRREIITRKDLYRYSDRVIMDMGRSCSDKRISDRWNYLPHLNKVYTKFNPVEDRKCFKLKTELKYIDPLVRLQINDFDLRLSDINKTAKSELNAFFNSDTDLYMYGEYED